MHRTRTSRLGRKRDLFLANRHDVADLPLRLGPKRPRLGLAADHRRQRHRRARDRQRHAPLKSNSSHDLFSYLFSLD
jgi:hypothetical protein